VIRKLDTESRRDVEQFVRLPFELYRGCPQWVPPMVSSVRFAMNRRKHPLYQHSTAEFFVAESAGKTLGRIAVIDHTNYNKLNGTRTAFFYYFDAVDDREVARELFGAAFDWAKGRGLNEMFGPKGLLTSDGGGILIEGFQYRPAMGIPYNYPYYDALAVDSGLEKRFDHLSGYVRGDHELPERLFAIAERVKATRGFWIKSFATKKELLGWVGRLTRVVNESFVGGLDYCPITEEEAKLAADQLAEVADPRLIKVVMKGDDIAGFVFGFPDLSAAIQRAGGRLWPLGWIYLLREYKRTKWVNANGLGLLPQYQGLGANAVLYTELYHTIRDFKFEHADIVQVVEENIRSRSDMETIGVDWYKRHRTYKRQI
jgi:hypothetical protein